MEIDKNPYSKTLSSCHYEALNFYHGETHSFLSLGGLLFFVIARSFPSLVIARATEVARGNLRALTVLSLRGPVKGRSNLSFGIRDCRVASLLAMTDGERPPTGCCHYEHPLFPFLSLRASEGGVAISLLGSSLSSVWFRGTRDCRVGTKTVPPRNDDREVCGFRPQLSKTALLGIVIARPRRGRGNLRALSTRDCRVAQNTGSSQ